MGLNIVFMFKKLDNLRYYINWRSIDLKVI